MSECRSNDVILRKKRPTFCRFSLRISKSSETGATKSDRLSFSRGCGSVDVGRAGPARVATFRTVLFNSALDTGATTSAPELQFLPNNNVNSFRCSPKFRSLTSIPDPSIYNFQPQTSLNPITIDANIEAYLSSSTISQTVKPINPKYKLGETAFGDTTKRPQTGHIDSNFHLHTLLHPRTKLRTWVRENRCAMLEKTADLSKIISEVSECSEDGTRTDAGWQ